MNIIEYLQSNDYYKAIDEITMPTPWDGTIPDEDIPNLKEGIECWSWIDEKNGIEYHYDAPKGIAYKNKIAPSFLDLVKRKVK